MPNPKAAIRYRVMRVLPSKYLKVVLSKKKKKVSKSGPIRVHLLEREIPDEIFLLIYLLGTKLFPTYFFYNDHPYILLIPI